jgi:hypothetical protein
MFARSMRKSQLHASFASAWVLVGCLSGQTGSPDCVGKVSCLCDPLYAPGPLLRVHGESADGNGHLVAVVDQVFALHPSDIRIGDRVGGSIIREKSCDPGYHADSLVGGDLFIMLFPGNKGGYPNCNAFQTCASASCAGLSEPGLTDCWNTCSAQTEASCGADREAALLDSAFSWVVPWGDTLDFGDPAHQISSADLAVLETVDTCLSRFPSAPAPACHDTLKSGGCSISGPAPGHLDQYAWPSLAALLGIAALLRRRHKA